MALCVKCNQDLPETSFYKSISHKNRDTSCKACRIIGASKWSLDNHKKKLEIEKKWIQEHPERSKEIKRNYKIRNPNMNHESYMRNRESRLEKQRESTRILRNEMIDAYGGRCTCCGEDRREFLTLEHKNGDGAEHRKGKGLYTIIRELRNMGFPKDNYSILCWNCNSSKYMYGVCPHDLEREVDHV